MKRLRAVLHEPLLQFLLAGALLLLAQRLFAPAASGALPATRIDVPAVQLDALRASFREVYGRAPNAQELAALAQRWIDDEVLYREALSLGLDRADPIVRRELQQKMRFLLEDTTPVAEPGEAELQQWLQDHAQTYAHAGTVSFQQVYISREPKDVSAAQRAAQIAAQLQQDPERYAALGDRLPGGALWQTQSDADLRRNFGEGFTQALAGLPMKQWSAPIASGLGLHLVRITARTSSRPATLDEVRRRVLVDCRQARREAANRKALDALRKRYDVRIAPLDS